MRWEKESPLSAQLPIGAGVVGSYGIVIDSDVGIDRLVTDLEDAPDATAKRHSPAIIVIGFPISRDERARRQVPALGEVIVEEGLQRHGIDVRAVIVTGKGPEVENQKASRDVQRFVRQKDDKARSGRPLSAAELIICRGGN